MYYECQAIYKTGINKGKKCGKNVCNIKSHIYQTLNYHEIHEIKHAYNLDNVYVDKCEYYSQFCVNDKINYMDIIKHIHDNRIGYAFELATRLSLKRKRAYEITIGIINHYKPLLDRQNSLYWNCLDKLYGEELKNAFVEKIFYFMDIYCSKYNRYYNLFLNKKTMDIHYFNYFRAKYKSNPIYKLLQ